VVGCGVGTNGQRALPSGLGSRPFWCRPCWIERVRVTRRPRSGQRRGISMKVMISAAAAAIALVATPGSADAQAFHFQNTPIPGFAYTGESRKLDWVGVSLTSIASEPVSGLVTFSLLDENQRPFASFSAPFYKEASWTAGPADLYRFELPFWDVDIRMSVDYDPDVGGADAIGWDGVVSYGSVPLPEPASWTMTLGGFGLIGGAMRHRRRAAFGFR